MGRDRERAAGYRAAATRARVLADMLACAAPPQGDDDQGDQGQRDGGDGDGQGAGGTGGTQQQQQRVRPGPGLGHGHGLRDRAREAGERLRAYGVRDEGDPEASFFVCDGCRGPIIPDITVLNVMIMTCVALATRRKFTESIKWFWKYTLRNIWPGRHGKLERAFECFAERPCFGRRCIVDGTPIDNYSWTSFAELYREISVLSSGLINKLHLAPHSRVVICGRNSIEWFIADIACIISTLVTVPLHPEWTADVMGAVIENCGAAAVLCSQESFLKLSSICNSRNCHMFCWDRSELSIPPTSQMEELKLPPGGVKPPSRSRDDPVTIVYTSGSTGIPKGVVYSDYLFSKITLTGYQMNQYDPLVSVSKDSLACSSDRLTAYSVLLNGGRTGIVLSPSTVLEDIHIISPCFLPATPRLWNVLFAQYQQTFNTARESILQNRSLGPSERHSTLEKERQCILSDVRSILGTRIRNITSGGAPINSEVMSFLHECWGSTGVTVAESYGSTEAGMIAGGDGTLHPSVEFKRYPRTWTEEMIHSYYNNVCDTSTAFDDEGWFHTGDIVELLGPRKIQIVDRIKNVFKLSQGEFVAPQKIEQALETNPLFSQTFVTCGDIKKFQQNNVAAVIVLNATILHQTIPGSSTATFSDLIQRPDTLLCVRQAIKEIASVQHLRSFETPIAIVLESIPFSVENGLLTSSRKLNRPALEKHYCELVANAVKDQIMASANSSPLSHLVADVCALNGVDCTAKGGNFVSFGGDSLAALRIVSTLRKKYNIDVPVDVLLDSSRDLSTIKIETLNISSSDEVLRLLIQDSPQDISYELIEPLPIVASDRPRGIFVTGVTGFIGAHVISELLKFYDDSTTIYCFFRTSTNVLEGDSVEYLLSHFRKMNILPGESARRIKTVQGDLSAPNLGIAEETLESLLKSGAFDHIYHLGAAVNHVSSYNMLRLPNVIGTKSLLSVALRARTKLFVYSSSVTVLDGTGNLMDVKMAASTDGYSASKWCAEQHVWNANKIHQLPVVVFRIGMVSFSLETGCGNISDWVHRLLTGIMELGSAPTSTSKFNLIPVDYVVKAIVSVSQLPNFQGTAVNLIHNELIPFSTIINWISQYHPESPSPISQQHLEHLSHTVPSTACKTPRCERLESLLLFSNGSIPDFAPSHGTITPFLGFQDTYTGVSSTGNKYKKRSISPLSTSLTLNKIT
ncbi:AMP-binding protein [Pelomyxa schiedti]|nr:AMP-binding protein [Pelomyxa schiedti]